MTPIPSLLALQAVEPYIVHDPTRHPPSVLHHHTLPASPCWATSLKMVSPETNGSTTTTSKTVQLIDEDCNFKYPSAAARELMDSDEVGRYIKDSKLEGFEYHLVAVFGSQSTGKSCSL